jgi:uncharacterized protein (DUF433 family)
MPSASIVRDPQVCHGQATVRGARILLSIVLDALADGMNEDEILTEYPTLTGQGIRAAAAHDVDTIRAEGFEERKDPAVLAGATTAGRLLLTLDRGLGDIRAHPPPTPECW